MDPLTLPELDARAAAVDALVLSSPPHDHFSCGMDWAIAGHQAFSPERRPCAYAAGGGYLTFAERVHPQGFAYFEPLEAQWGLACPLIGADPVALVAALDQLLVENASATCAVLGGVVYGSELERMVKASFLVRAQPGMPRFVASLDGGLDGFLARRTRNQRKSILAAVRGAGAAGIAFEDGATLPPQAAFARMLAVERASWKGGEGTGICEEPLATFCRLLLERLANNRRLRLLFARKDDADVGYIFGAVFGGCYRGLQFSYAESQRAIALGSALQHQQIAALCAEGIHDYDLGTTSPHYKTRWAEIEIKSQVLVVRRGW